MNKNYFITRPCCPGCKSISHKTIYSCGFLESPVKEYIESFYSCQGGVEFEYLKGNKFVLRECNDCGLIYQEEIPNEFLMGKLYEEWIDPEIVFNQDLHNHGLDYYALYAQEIMVLIAYLNTKPGQLKYFDFGMGWGRWAIMAMAFGCDTYGSELSHTRLEFAKSRGIKVITWKEILDHQFDFINTEQVFEHIPEPLETLMYLKKALKSGGIIKISVPDGHDIKRRLSVLDWTAPKYSRYSLNAVSQLEHINCFNRASMIEMADIAGLEIVNLPLRIQYTHATNWKLIKPALKNILYPLYHDVLKRGTYIFFRQKRLKER